MPGLRVGSACVMNASHVVTAVGTVPDRMVYALVGEEANHEHILDADIA